MPGSCTPNISSTVTGSVVLRSRLENFVSWNQITSFSLALAVISILLIFLFGSKKAGFIAILPNLFPVLAVFGLQGLFNVPLTFLSAMTAPVLLGIAVDDTIHFLTHYRQNIKEGYDIEGSISQSFSETGVAIFFTTIILAIGFAVMTTHHLSHISNMGIFVSLAIVMAFFADLFFLPALLKTFNIDFKKSAKDETQTTLTNQDVENEA